MSSTSFSCIVKNKGEEPLIRAREVGVTYMFLAQLLLLSEERAKHSFCFISKSWILLHLQLVNLSNLISSGILCL